MSLRRLETLLVGLFAMTAGTGCSPRGFAQPAHERAPHSQVAPKLVDATGCASSDPRLAFTGLCRPDAASLMLAAPGASVVPPEGCGWTIGEVAISETQAILYRAAQCPTGTAKLAYVPGEPFARLTLIASPYEDSQDPAYVIARVTKAGDRPAILRIARSLIRDPAKRARCQVRKAGFDEWPADALVIDEVPAPIADGVRSACGELGLDEGSQTFWRLSQGLGWFFELGQESPVVDAGSFTRIHRTAAGVWQRW